MISTLAVASFLVGPAIKNILVGAAKRGRPAQYLKEIDAVLPSGLRDAAFDFDLNDDSNEWGNGIEHCEALILTSRGLGATAIARARRLRFVQKLGVDGTRVDASACKKAGIALSVLPDAGHVAVAEHCIMLMLASTRKLLPTRDAFAKGENPLAPVPVETGQNKRYPNWLGLPESDFPLLCDLTLGLIGFGEIAREVATRARALGMSVVYTKRSRLPAPVEAEFGVAFLPLDDLLRSSHFASLHATLPDGAPPIIGANELAKMRPDAVLVNTSRGNQVDERALAAALASRRIAGALLDVFRVEPVTDQAFAQLPGLVATPHTAGVMPNGRR